MTAQTTTLDNLCEDVLRILFDKYLDFRTRCRVKMVCKRFNRIVDDLFDHKRHLLLTDHSKQLNDICDEDFTKYSVMSVQDLCQLREGVWVRGDRGLKLLDPIDIQMLVLKRCQYLTSLCLVVHQKTPHAHMESLFDLIVQNCSADLEKLIIINNNCNHFSINNKQMKDLCRQFSRLKHFEIYSDYLYATEDCFAILLKECPKLEVFRLNVRQIFNESVIELTGPPGRRSRSFTYESYKFDGHSFAESMVRLKTIDVSNPFLNEMSLAAIMSTNVNPFLNVKHLGVERLSPEWMQDICYLFKSLESLSFSVKDELDDYETKILMSLIGRYENLKKLSIRWFGRYHYPDKTEVHIDDNNFKALQNCQNLRHLVIKEAILDDYAFQVINRSVPLLESLRIVDCALEKTSFDSITQFKRLKQLIVMNSYPEQSYLKFDFTQKSYTIDQIVMACCESRLIGKPELKKCAELDDESMDGFDLVSDHNYSSFQSDVIIDDDMYVYNELYS